jgi:virginiamycin B lyase
LRLRLLSLVSIAAVAVLLLACSGSKPESPAPVDQAPDIAPSPPPASTAPARAGPSRAPVLQSYPVPAGSHPHDVAPAVDGGVWYTAQATGKLGRLDANTGTVTEIPLGAGSAPHGVIVGPDGAAWVTDGGLNAILRVDASSRQVTRFPMPAGTRNLGLNTAAFDKSGRLWFTGQAGAYGSLDPSTGSVRVYEAPPGPYGITVTPAGEVFYASLAGSHVAKIDPSSGGSIRLDPPTRGQGARRVWSDSRGRVWVSEWNAGKVAVFDPGAGAWQEWTLPGQRPQAYAVYVDELDKVWLSDFGANAILRFDPSTQAFESFPLPDPGGAVRQLNGRPGEIWGAESASDKLVVLRY